MKRKVRFLYPAIFVKDEDGSCQAIFPDLNIYTNGKDVSEAFLYAKDLLYVYMSYAMKYDTEFNDPTKIEDIKPKCKINEIAMYVDADVEVEVWKHVLNGKWQSPLFLFSIFVKNFQKGYWHGGGESV